MPYDGFLQAARQERYDLELLGHRFRTSHEQVCHRLTTLRKPGNEGIPFHMVRIDIARQHLQTLQRVRIQVCAVQRRVPRWNRLDCEQRAYPPVQHPLAVNEHTRGVSFYAR